MNVIFIVADDLGWGDVGYHSDDAITPNIDDLSSKGIRLENFYVQACCQNCASKVQQNIQKCKYLLSSSTF